MDFLLATYSTSAALGPSHRVQHTQRASMDSSCVVKKENRILKAAHCISSQETLTAVQLQPSWREGSWCWTETVL